MSPIINTIAHMAIYAFAAIGVLTVGAIAGLSHLDSESRADCKVWLKDAIEQYFKETHQLNCKFTYGGSELDTLEFFQGTNSIKFTGVNAEVGALFLDALAEKVRADFAKLKPTRTK